MHDIGKIGIPDNILQKPGKLTAEEYEVIKGHPQIGADIIGETTSNLLFVAKQVALYHHEKWNGTGYPHGLKGEDIPLVARIVAVADVFDALTSERPYKKAWPIEDVLELMRKESGAHFEPKLVELLEQNLGKFLEIKEKWSDE
jgi:putative two-component system response regulator